MLFGMGKLRHLAILLILCAMPLFAQLADSDPQTKSACEGYLKTPLPPEASLVATPERWPECNSYKLYSGIGTKADFAAARRCAWSERLAQKTGFEPRFTIASIFGGSAMLAVVYANGNGIPQDVPLAEKFACEAEGAPAEIRYRLKHLDEMRTGSAPSSHPFKFCDDITSGFMQGFCAGYDSELADEKSSKALEALAAQLSQEQRKAFSDLNKSERAYVLAHAKGEIDLSGTARPMYQIDAQDTLRDDFIAALQSFEAGKYPNGDAAYRDADAKLNVVYRRTISNAEQHKNDYGAVQPDGIRDAERAWLKYRDAWMTFAKLRYPSVPPEAWLILLTSDRTSILDGSFCDMDAAEGPCALKGDTWKPSPLP